tara:strand:+ start:4882 stop:5229 length:348 start_codon:yes stop_codon:yes gene_type:complete
VAKKPSAVKVANTNSRNTVCASDEYLFLMTPVPNILSFKRLVPGLALMKQLRHPLQVPLSGRQYSEQVLQNDELEADNSNIEQYDNRLNKTENGSPNLSHSRLPKVNIPIQVIIE